MVCSSRTDGNRRHRIYHRVLGLLRCHQRELLYGSYGMYFNWCILFFTLKCSWLKMLPFCNYAWNKLSKQKNRFSTMEKFDFMFHLLGNRKFISINCRIFSVLSSADCDNHIWGRNRFIWLHQTRWIEFSFGQRIQWNTQKLQSKWRSMGFSANWSTPNSFFL